ncbi:hypothetical protein R3P38DRAFT_2853865 [Favolaschia claudopus]|uniref:Uncharacterized protein n=1 Tax=Favolaschia claudopus TaxID=2862362 RepID=A0AAW0DTY6_9AGAR
MSAQTPYKYAVVIPARQRSNSVIISWAANVQPGSPAPLSPRRRPSVCSRRPSGSISFVKDSLKPFDLTQVGYSSVFVQFPVDPCTPSLFIGQVQTPEVPLPTSTKAPSAPKRFRSLSTLTRSRSKSVSASVPVAPMPSSTIHKASSSTKTPAVCAITKRRKSVDHHKNTAPMPLANELALMQLLGGGSIESHAKRVMTKQAKAAGPGVGVGEVFRDEKGGIWWDEEERWEYKHLLDREQQRVPADAWVQFRGKENEDASEERRGSVSTQDSDLDVRYLVKPAEDEGMADFVPLPDRRRSGKASARPAKHLNKPGLQLVDVDAAFGAPQPNARRRRGAPAPLQLSGSAHADQDVFRKDFFASSFAPAPLTAPPVPVSPYTMPASALPSSSHVRRMSTVSVATVGSKGKSLKNLFRRRD